MQSSLNSGHSRLPEVSASLPWLAGIVFIGLALRMLTFVGLNGADDITIAQLALRLLDSGPWLPTGHYPGRIGLIWPVAGIYGVFGVGELQTAMLPFALSILSIPLTYLIGRRVAGERAGLFGALVIALFPLDVYFSSQLMPDLPLGVTLAGAFYLALRATDQEASSWWGIASGLTWGLAYLMKVEAAFLAVPMFMLAAANLHAWRRMALVFIAVGAVLVAESAAYMLAGGEFLHRLVAIENTEGFKGTETHSATQLWVFPKAWFVTFYFFGLHYYFLAAALVWTVVLRRRHLYIIATWLVVYLLWLQFGGNPFSDSYSVKSHMLRYCSMASVPMAVLVGALLASIPSESKAKTAGTALLLALPALFFINFNSLSMERQLATKAGLDHAVEHGLFPLYSDSTSRAIASIYLYGTPQADQVFSLQQHNYQTQETAITPIDEVDGYVLLNRGFMEYAWNRYRKDQVNTSSTNTRTIYTVDNPANALAYTQARFLSETAALIPSSFLKNKIGSTAKDLLRPQDAVILVPERKAGKGNDN